MSDFHFVVRHGLTGIVLLVFVGAGVFVVNDRLALDLVARHSSYLKDLSSVLPLLVSAPIVGITIQGVYIYLVDRFGAGIFKDEARRLMLRRLNNALRRPEAFGMSPHHAVHFRDHVLPHCEACPDAVFVWLYHTSAPPHLIEWARRRRSYHYLGYNWAISGALGLLCGVLIGLQFGFAGWDRFILLRLLALATSVVWIGGACYLGRLMRRDVDSMELIWAFAHVYPDLQDVMRRNDILALPGTVSPEPPGEVPSSRSTKSIGVFRAAGL